MQVVAEMRSEMGFGDTQEKPISDIHTSDEEPDEDETFHDETTDETPVEPPSPVATPVVTSMEPPTPVELTMPLVVTPVETPPPPPSPQEQQQDVEAQNYEKTAELPNSRQGKPFSCSIGMDGTIHVHMATKPSDSYHSNSQIPTKAVETSTDTVDSTQ